MSRTKTPLASENFVDVFILLSRWQLDPVDISCRQFRYVISTMMNSVCLREFDSIRFIPTTCSGHSTMTMPLDVKWLVAENEEHEDLSICFNEMKEAIEDTTKRITSSAVECIEFWKLDFTDEMLAKIVETMGSVHVDKLDLTRCDFSSTVDGSVRALISSFASLRALTLNECSLMPPHFTNELLLDCSRRPELTKAYFNVRLPSANTDVETSVLNVDEEAEKVHIGPLDAGIMALLFREVGQGVDVTFRRAWHLDACISDAFSKRLLETAQQYTGTNTVKLAVMGCNTEEQMSHLVDFQQCRRTVAASARTPAKQIYDLPVNGRTKCTLTFSEGIMMSPRMMRFESGLAADL